MVTGNCCGCCKAKKPFIEPSFNSIQNEDAYDRKVAYSADLPKNLHTGNGKLIVVQGKILPNCFRFAINLYYKKDQHRNLALHFNPRLKERYVVRNSRIHNNWGDEETTSNVKFDFKQNIPFKVEILLTNDQYMITINGKHFCNFNYRVPKILITNIEIVGLVDNIGVTYEIIPEYPRIQEAYLNIPVNPTNANLNESHSLDVPFTGILPEGFMHGYQLEVYGRIKILPHSFTVNLQDGTQLWPHPIIPLHLNPRFNTAGGVNAFVRNVWVDGAWGAEERSPNFPFMPGEQFTLVLRRDMDFFTIWVDGKLCGEFKERMSKHGSILNQINSVYINGDLKLYSVCIRSTNAPLQIKPNKRYTRFEI